MIKFYQQLRILRSRSRNAPECCAIHLATLLIPSIFLNQGLNKNDESGECLSVLLGRQRDLGIYRLLTLRLVRDEAKAVWYEVTLLAPDAVEVFKKQVLTKPKKDNRRPDSH
ncbi:hypothetical protein HG530_014537 [Fusarium avenaceum]|nr:hypothetical protein HG530_014537 [Fusarium avenaceum]